MDCGNEWFVRWFSSPYYALLYSQRGIEEAQAFVSKLIAKLQPLPGARILDLACGYGRHSVALHNAGFRVTGIDLSAEAIAHAKKYQSTGLNFIRADMRHFQLYENFDLILNLFTSFGYFETEEENELVLDRVKSHLAPGGWFVLDYFNLQFALDNFCTHEDKFIGDVFFSIDKRVEGQQAVKTIRIRDGSLEQEFEERVQLLTPLHLEGLLQAKGFDVIHIFGDYHLGAFEPATSDRLILATRST